PAVRLLVVGAGKYGQERRLAQLATARGLAGAVVVAGWQEPDALPGVLAAADVALFPADDNLANRAKCSVKLLQALWLGLPVVADWLGQLADYLSDDLARGAAPDGPSDGAGEPGTGGACGLLSDPDDPATMAAQAVRLLRDPTLARRLGEAGRRRVARDFAWPHLAARAEQAYAAALQAHGRATSLRRRPPGRVTRP